ncbi:hypothetical protein B0H13DRAFT_1912419 [Mycena leptocephala]|nr:hypothetical protein B0H13DRAFT_1912419 [Mycena leptocephala]
MNFTVDKRKRVWDWFPTTVCHSVITACNELIPCVLALEECSGTLFMDQNQQLAGRVRFADDQHDDSSQYLPNLRQKSPPPPYDSQEDCLEELRLDLVIAEEGIWRLELALIQEHQAATGTADPPASFPPPPYSSLVVDWPSWVEASSIFELQLDLLIAQERIRVLM